MSDPDELFDELYDKISRMPRHRQRQLVVGALPAATAIYRRDPTNATVRQLIRRADVRGGFSIKRPTPEYTLKMMAAVIAIALVGSGIFETGSYLWNRHIAEQAEKKRKEREAKKLAEKTKRDAERKEQDDQNAIQDEKLATIDKMAGAINNSDDVKHLNSAVRVVVNQIIRPLSIALEYGGDNIEASGDNIEASGDIKDHLADYVCWYVHDVKTYSEEGAKALIELIPMDTPNRDSEIKNRQNIRNILADAFAKPDCKSYSSHGEMMAANPKIFNQINAYWKSITDDEHKKTEFWWHFKEAIYNALSEKMKLIVDDLANKIYDFIANSTQYNIGYHTKNRITDHAYEWLDMLSHITPLEKYTEIDQQIKAVLAQQNEIAPTSSEKAKWILGERHEKNIINPQGL